MAATQTDPPAARKQADPQTGKEYDIRQEGGLDRLAATISIVYTLAVIALLGSLLTSIWVEQRLPSWVLWNGTPSQSNAILNVDPLIRLVGFAAIGGALGAAISNIRGFILWHAELMGFGWRFVWKYVSLPPLGATLGVAVYALIRGGLAAFEGANNTNTGSGAVADLAALATGTLAGYGSHKVFIWLDDRVNKLFSVKPADQAQTTARVKVPNLIGKTEEDAKTVLAANSLEPGTITRPLVNNPDEAGKVVVQQPEPDTEVDKGSQVGFSIGTAEGAPQPAPGPTG